VKLQPGLYSPEAAPDSPIVTAQAGLYSPEAAPHCPIVTAQAGFTVTCSRLLWFQKVDTQFSSFFHLLVQHK